MTIRTKEAYCMGTVLIMRPAAADDRLKLREAIIEL
jgi:hypothetical protein